MFPQWDHRNIWKFKNFLSMLHLGRILKFLTVGCVKWLFACHPYELKRKTPFHPLSGGPFRGASDRIIFCQYKFRHIYLLSSLTSNSILASSPSPFFECELLLEWADSDSGSSTSVRSIELYLGFNVSVYWPPSLCRGKMYLLTIFYTL